jgi:hypothetical protein
MLPMLMIIARSIDDGCRRFRSALVTRLQSNKRATRAVRLLLLGAAGGHLVPRSSPGTRRFCSRHSGSTPVARCAVSRALLRPDALRHSGEGDLETITVLNENDCYARGRTLVVYDSGGCGQ